jgi:hypothetical protein
VRIIKSNEGKRLAVLTFDEAVPLAAKMPSTYNAIVASHTDDKSIATLVAAMFTSGYNFYDRSMNQHAEKVRNTYKPYLFVISAEIYELFLAKHANPEWGPVVP